MSIMVLRRATLCGLMQDKQKVLEELQILGCLHLVSLRPAPREPEKAAPEHAKDAYEALRFLTDWPRKRRQIRDERNFHFDDTVAQILQYKQRTRDAVDRRDFLNKRIKDLEPWGDFTFPPLDELGGYRLWFYEVPLNQLEKLPGEDWVWQVLHRDHRFAYVVIVAQEEPPGSIMPVPRTHVGSLSLSELRHQLDLVEIELDHLVGRREAFTRYIYLLTQNLNRAEDRATLNHAGEQTLDDENIFAVQGWVSENRLSRLDQFAQRNQLALLLEDPDPDDKPPTLLDNPKTVSGGEDLVTFYQTPGYHDWDPSAVLFFSFSLFFAMILSDAGYALLLAAIVGYYWRRMGQSPGGRRFRLVAATALVFSLIYGILVGSYFGVSPPEDSFPGYFHILDINSLDTMMRVSIVIGCLHLALANGIVAYRAGGLPASGPPLGWICVIFGGLLLWLGQTILGTLLLMGGVLLIAVFASTRPVNSVKSALWRVLESLNALTNLTKMFGDVLSYMRLFALGLASASLALTFNQLAGEIREETPGLGLLLSILVLLIGHGINVGLCIMSGFVHGLRLNFIEFFNWGLSEEGRPFQAFEKKETNNE